MPSSYRNPMTRATLSSGVASRVMNSRSLRVMVTGSSRGMGASSDSQAPFSQDRAGVDTAPAASPTGEDLRSPSPFNQSPFGLETGAPACTTGAGRPPAPVRARTTVPCSLHVRRPAVGLLLHDGFGEILSAVWTDLGVVVYFFTAIDTLSHSTQTSSAVCGPVYPALSARQTRSELEELVAGQLGRYPRELPPDHEEPVGHQEQPRHDLDGYEVPLRPREPTHRPGEEQPRKDEGHGESHRIDEQERGTPERTATGSG